MSAASESFIYNHTAVSEIYENMGIRTALFSE